MHRAGVCQPPPTITQQDEDSCPGVCYRLPPSPTATTLVTAHFKPVRVSDTSYCPTVREIPVRDKGSRGRDGYATQRYPRRHGRGPMTSTGPAQEGGLLAVMCVLAQSTVAVRAACSDKMARLLCQGATRPVGASAVRAPYHIPRCSSHALAPLVAGRGGARDPEDTCGTHARYVLVLAR